VLPAGFEEAAIVARLTVFRSSLLRASNLKSLVELTKLGHKAPAWRQPGSPHQEAGR
jgi:hypothetical protein